MRHFYAFSLLVPSYQAGLDFYFGFLYFLFVEVPQISAHKRWLVIARKAEYTKNITLKKGSTNAQTSAVGQQIVSQVVFLQSDDFHADYAAMRVTRLLTKTSRLLAPRQASPPK